MELHLLPPAAYYTKTGKYFKRKHCIAQKGIILCFLIQQTTYFPFMFIFKTSFSDSFLIKIQQSFGVPFILSFFLFTQLSYLTIFLPISHILLPAEPSRDPVFCFIPRAPGAAKGRKTIQSGSKRNGAFSLQQGGTCF